MPLVVCYCICKNPLAFFIQVDISIYRQCFHPALIGTDKWLVSFILSHGVARSHNKNLFTIPWGGVNRALVSGPDPDFFYAFSCALNNKTDERMKQFENQRGPTLVHMRAGQRREVFRCLSRSPKRQQPRVGHVDTWIRDCAFNNIDFNFSS